MRTGMNVLLWTAFLTDTQFPILTKLKAAGYDGAELPLFSGEEAHYAKVGRELKRQGLGCTAVTVMTPEANPVSPDPKVRAAAVERLRWAIACTAAAGGDVLCGPLHSALGVFTGQGPTDDERQWCADVLRAAAELAGKANVRLAVEFLCRFESYFLTTVADSVRLAQAVNHPALGILYDTFHANIEEKDPVAAIRLLAPHLYHVHISENDRGTPGTGHIAWEATFAALRRVGYDGWLTIESFGREMPEIAAATRAWRDFAPSAEEVYGQGLGFMQRMWRQAGASQRRAEVKARPRRPRGRLR